MKSFLLTITKKILSTKEIKIKIFIQLITNKITSIKINNDLIELIIEIFVWLLPIWVTIFMFHSEIVDQNGNILLQTAIFFTFMFVVYFFGFTFYYYIKR